MANFLKKIFGIKDKIDLGMLHQQEMTSILKELNEAFCVKIEEDVFRNDTEKIERAANFCLYCRNIHTKVDDIGKLPIETTSYQQKVDAIEAIYKDAAKEIHWLLTNILVKDHPGVVLSEEHYSQFFAFIGNLPGNFGAYVKP
jgi:hypothetical protein